ncbi:MAG: hypothetical protein GY801_12675, partial [bacterium]|nr:hypothetical protein [bacterium]
SGFVGMCALFCGARLGRYFSYPFAIYFGGLLCPVVLGSLAAIGVNVPVDLMYPGWITGVVLGVLCGWILSGVISVYGRWSRLGAVFGAVLMLLWGIHLMPGWTAIKDKCLTDPGEVILLLLVLAGFALFGGAPGALLGAVIDSRANRRPAQPRNDRKLIRNILFCIAATLVGGAVLLVLKHFCPVLVGPPGYNVDGPVIFIYLLMITFAFITLGCLIASVMWILILLKK